MEQGEGDIIVQRQFQVLSFSETEQSIMNIHYLSQLLFENTAYK